MMKFTKLSLHGGDKVRLKSGKVITINDLNERYVIVSSVEWYPIKDVVEILEPWKKP